MALEPITTAEGLGLARGSAVVCIYIANAGAGVDEDERALVTTQSVVEHTDSSTPVLIAGTAAQIEGVYGRLPVQLRERTLLSLPLDSAVAESQAVNAAAQASFPSDLVVVAPGIRVATDWLRLLQAAALSDSTVASATPLSVGAGALELFDDRVGYPGRGNSRPCTQGRRAQPATPPASRHGGSGMCVYPPRHA